MSPKIQHLQLAHGKRFLPILIAKEFFISLSLFMWMIYFLDYNCLDQVLHKQFTIKDLGEAKHFLRLELACCPKVFTSINTKYTLDLFFVAKSASTPMVRSPTFFSYEGPKFDNPKQYPQLVG